MSIEALKHALETLEEVQMAITTTPWMNRRIEELRAAILQAEKQEPVACPYCRNSHTLGAVYFDQNCVGCVKRMTAPSQREWQNAALRIGEELSSVGPDGYYAMSSSEWLDWALAQNPKGKTSLQQREAICDLLEKLVDAYENIDRQGSAEDIRKIIRHIQTRGQ